MFLLAYFVIFMKECADYLSPLCQSRAVQTSFSAVKAHLQLRRWCDTSESFVRPDTSVFLCWSTLLSAVGADRSLASGGDRMLCVLMRVCFSFFSTSQTSMKPSWKGSFTSRQLKRFIMTICAVPPRYLLLGFAFLYYHQSLSEKLEICSRILTWWIRHTVN